MLETTKFRNAKRLSLEDFAKQFGTTIDDIPQACREMISARDFNYEFLKEAERDAVILELLHRIEKKEFSIVKEGDKARWEKGWGENLNEFLKAPNSVDALTPRYIRKNVPFRLNQNFAVSNNDDFEMQWYEIYRHWFLTKYFKGFENIFEFGSGSGFTVAALARMYPEALVTGLDWVQPSVDIVNKLHEIQGLNTRGRLFDFFNPDNSVEIPAGSAILTGGALEQTGTNNEPFLNFLIEKKPALVVHIEPIYDWYDPDNLVDYLAIKAHEVKNFWRGYVEKLTQMEKQGKIEIIKRQRTYFGSLVLEGYSQLVWRFK